MFFLFRTDILFFVVMLLIIKALSLDIFAAGTVDFNVEIITSINPSYLYSHLDYWLLILFATVSTAK